MKTKFHSEKAGVYKVPYYLIFFPIPIFKILIFFPKISVPFPSFPLDNVPYSLNIIEQMILLPLTLFSTWYSSQKPLNSLPLFTTWNSSPKDLINFHPPPGVGNEELYTPLWKRERGDNDVYIDFLYVTAHRLVYVKNWFDAWRSDLWYLGARLRENHFDCENKKSFYLQPFF